MGGRLSLFHQQMIALFSAPYLSRTVRVSSTSLSNTFPHRKKTLASRKASFLRLEENLSVSF